MDPYEFGPADIGTDRPEIEDFTDALEMAKEIRRRVLIRACEMIDPNGEFSDATLPEIEAALIRLRSID